MDNKKIGKLIAKLRKEQGLTQQDLGDKVGVGFRAVSKWERGLTLPDISIINDVSKILGISSDELLSGEIKRDDKVKEKKKIPTKFKIIISIITLIIVLVSTIVIYYDSKTYVYDISSTESEKYYIKGNVIFNKNNTSIIINEIKFKDPNFSLTKIKNYEYDLKSSNEYLFRYGYIYDIEAMDEIVSISEFADTFNANHNTQIALKRSEMLENNVVMTFRFLTDNDEEITKEIEIKLDFKK
ncbi:MAG: helix-turn-helix transcriptional regulator [Bacilli bacterium]|nr:helix-turn-helix transcriptional regulator [Bacilli bacterium]